MCHPERSEGPGRSGRNACESQRHPSPRSLAHARDDIPVMPTAQARTDIRTYKGIGVSPGIAIGRAVIVEKRIASVYRVPIREEEVASEVTRFMEALEKTRDELLDLKQKVSRSMGDEYAQIFEAHAMIVTDPSFND